MESMDTRDALQLLHSVPDDVLLRRLGELVFHSRRVEADLVSHIGEVEQRRLYASEACPSMFSYCTERLHLSEAEAYLRITVARAAREHAVLLTMLGDGRLHLSGIVKLLPILTRENQDVLLKRATNCSKRQILELVAELSPRLDAPTIMRKLPQARPAPRVMGGLSQERPTLTQGPDPNWRAVGLGPDAVPTPRAGQPAARVDARLLELGPDRVEFSAGPSTPGAVDRMGGPPFELGPDAAGAPPCVPPAPPSRPAVVEPLSPARYKVQFTASARLHDKLERLRALMRAEVPDGDLVAIIEQAVTEKLERIEDRRFARTSAPRKELRDTATSPTSRHIPAAVRRAVRERDGDRCRYVDAGGRRCSERDRLEFHHRHPFGMGGDHSPANLRLLCPSHNRYLAEHDYGRAVVTQRPREERPPLS
jgi:5-methylcytosine-specific restriction endonuclease McrA